MFNYMNFGCIMTLVAAPLIEMSLMTLNDTANFHSEMFMSSHRGCLGSQRLFHGEITHS